MGDLLWMLVQAAAIVAVGSFLGSWATGVARSWMTRTDLDPLVRRLLVSWVRPLFLIFAVLAALRHLGVDLTSAVAVLGAATLAIGLAIRGSLSNVAAGAVLLSTQPYRAGELVEIAGKVGTIEEMTLFHTLMKTANGLFVIAPNTQVLNSTITNFSANGQRRVDLALVVDGKANLDKVEEILLASLTAQPGILAEPAPSFTVVDVLPYGVQVRASGWSLNEHYGASRSAGLRAALAGLKKSRIALATTAHAEV
ncbi:MAG: mechanosensitive ion channel family protein [Proteobacteria bacterium]|nr:mechanosensitive ion channel family protein [Pseudomonadota bacterium]